MCKKLQKLCSVLLVFVMFINLLPLNVLAEEYHENKTAADIAATDTNPEDVQIVSEVTEKRTEFSKEYKLSNGLHMAAVYPEAVHYEENGEWKDIDNTLQLAKVGDANAYINTAGIWDVAFPEQLSDDRGVTISKDGYTLYFFMSGELHTNRGSELMAEDDATGETAVEEPITEEQNAEEIHVEETVSEESFVEDIDAEEVSSEETCVEETSAYETTTEELSAEDATNEETASVPGTVVEDIRDEEVDKEKTIPAENMAEETNADRSSSEKTDAMDQVAEKTPVDNAIATDEALPMVLEATEVTTAEVLPVDLSKMIAETEFPETISEVLHSRLEYANVYTNTDIVYDLTSNQLKESIVIDKYSDTLRGYQYNLDVGKLKPVLTQSGKVELYDETGENIIMIMPAPYLVDDAQEYCYDVTVDLRQNGDYYTLTYILPQEWMANENRKWPVVLDPIVSATSNYTNIKDQNVYSNAWANPEAGVLQCGYNSSKGLGKMRFYLQYVQIPVLTSADIIVSAAVHLYKPATSGTETSVEVHKVTETWDSLTMQWSNMASFDETIEDFAISKASGLYSWDVTDIVRGWYEGENTGMMFKNPDSVENEGVESWKQFISSDYGSDNNYKPTLLIMFRNNNGLESYWDYTASSAGRAGTGYINNYSGNLVWVRDDIGFGGNRMPVSISHIYNANDSLNNTFGMGYGWRTNFNQKVYQWTDTNAYGSYYVWEDADGTKHYFKLESTGIYKDEDGLELTLRTNNSGTEPYSITDKYGNVSWFDSSGRLTRQVNNQATPSSISISYTTTTGNFISTITDGVGRVYSFTYPNNLLSRISYKGSGSKELSYVSFGYTGSQLTSVTDEDSEVSRYTYTSQNLLSTVQDIDGYKLTYSYNIIATGKPARVSKVVETDGNGEGGTLSIEYAQNQTTFMDTENNVQIMQFNNWGNTVAIQDDQGRAQYAQYAINDVDTAAISDTTAKGNQLRLYSKLQNTVGNVLKDSSFENSETWTATSSAATQSIASGTAYLGNKSLKLYRSAAGTAAGVSSASFAVAVGETYTFSAYVKTDGNATAYLALKDGSTTVRSETTAKTEWTRLEIAYTASSAQSVTAQLLTETAGTVYMDCVQVEKATTASRYNLIENGDFRYTTSWSSSSGRTVLPNTAAPELSTNVYSMTGNPAAKNRISQTVQVSGTAGDDFILGGWAKGDSAPLEAYDSNPREFGIIATFNNTDGTTTTSTIRFNPYTDSSVNWQYAAAPIVAKKDYSSIKIEVAYDYNVNTVYFDGIQLYKESFGNSYEYDEDGNVVSIVDLQKQTTQYEYNANQDLVKQILPTGAELNYTYDDYHNVLTATTEEGLSYGFTYDAWGNNTSVAIISGDLVMNSTATYSTDGNCLVSTTDASGNTTQYSYNTNTNVLEWVKYPKDTDATRTEYTYDSMYRLASAETTTDKGYTLNASYAYTDDLLTKIETGSTTYSFSYGDFALRSAIKIGSRTLASYTYTNKTNYLASLDYGNGDSVDYTYDQQGRVTQETYEDGDTVTYKYDNNGALASVMDSATGIETKYYYDFTDRLMKYVESGDGYSHSVGYEYDKINNLTARIETINGTEYKTTYAYDDDNRVTSVTNGQTSEDYTYDAYSRVNVKETKDNGSTVLTDTFTYRNPTDTTTSGQVATLTSAATGYNVTYSYTYDNNGNILSVNDGANITSYVYDSANQLIRENNQAVGKTWVWTYDNAGNITSRKEYDYTTADNPGTPNDTVDYTYGDSAWGDLLTAYGGNIITSDTIGNPETVKDEAGNILRSYIWEHGRELVSMSGESINGDENDVAVDYEYNADGLRIKKTVTTNIYNEHEHTYTATVVAATCTEGGYTLHTCECGDSYQDNETAARGHFFATSTSICSRCGASQHEHSYTSTVIEPTCTEVGYTIYECSCGYSYQGDVTSAKGHLFATSTSICSRCGAEQHEHSYTSTVVVPTCTENGYTLYTCECGDSYEDALTEALGHSLSSTSAVCSRCGEAHLHSYTSTVVAPTCTEEGYTLYECICGYSYQADVTSARGHYYPTASSTVCTRCGATRVVESTASVYALDTTSTTSTTVIEYNYIYSGSTLVELGISAVVDNGMPTTDTLTFTYDSVGHPVTVSSDDGTYYYVTNLQGDVTAILNASGSAVVQYTYDAWGNILSTTGSLSSTLGEVNPLRYRGYVYDTESGLYYLQSRYYDPELGRFVNSDIFATTGKGLLGNNMFAYCNNCPIILSDCDGQTPETVFDIISLGASIVDVAVNPWDPWAWLGLLGDVADVAIPCVGGLGEAVDALKAMNVIDDTVDIAKLTENTLKVVATAANAASTGGEFVYTAYQATQTGMLEYVGITNDFARREAEWSNVREIKPYISNVDRDTARCAEQTIISLFGRNGDTLSNIRNSIGVNGRLKKKFVDFFTELF